MTNYHKFPIIFLLWLVYSCNPDSNKNIATPAINDTISVKKTDSLDTYTVLASRMRDTVTLTRLLDKITHQEKVKVISTLSTTWDDVSKRYIYSDSNYVFQLEQNPASLDKQKSNSIFLDRGTRISFEDYEVTCYHDTVFRCEDYGFNWDNSLDSPKIIEVCGKRFLYSNVNYMCNGMGCGCFLTFIYDLETRKPTFIENYRIPYNNRFFISDFDNDNNPDLLVISKTIAKKMKGFDLEEFELRLTPFSYSNGVFKPSFDRQYYRTYGYFLYGFSEGYHHSYYQENMILSITEDNWFRQ